MHNMLDEFYNFIAQTIISYFLKLENNSELQNAESFSLKLDDEKMVQGVEQAIKHQLINSGIYKTTEIDCLLGEKYNALTAKLSNDKELIIAAQTKGMSNDFLCATLRNGAKEENKSILMISSTLIDSAISGSRNMAGFGMPFYHKTIINNIRELAKESTLLNNAEKKIIEFELKRRESDAFCDKESFYEYVDLLSIINAGSIDNDLYKNFRLFPIKAKTEYETLNDTKIEKYLKENNELFEKFSTSIKFSSVDKDFAKEFEPSFLKDIKNKINNDPENWSDIYFYSDFLAEKEKKDRKTDNPLKIESSDIEIQTSNNVFPLEQDKNYVICKDGKQTGKKRKQSVIVFNSKIAEKIYIKYNCNAFIKKENISSEIDVKISKEDNKIVFEYVSSGLIFDKASISDSANSITYEFSICILDIAPQYLIDLVQYKGLVNAKKKLIKISDVNNSVIFNKQASNEISNSLIERGVYSCKLDEKLILTTDEKTMLDYDDGMSITIEIGGISVSLLLFSDTSGNEEITGKRLLRDKYWKKESFTIANNMRMHRDSYEYFAKGNLLKELRLEKQIIERQIIIGHIKHLNSFEESYIEEENLAINEKVKQAYIEFVLEINKNKTLPTLLYLKNELLEKAKYYIETFIEYYKDLKNEQPLTSEQINTSLIGTITVDNNDEVWLTPLHPLNIAYQLSLTNETGFDDASDIILDRLSSTNLFPYLKIEDKNFKVSDQSSSLEWNYYAPIENKKYRGSRKFVPKLVEDKIVEYVNHFKYLFNEIGNYNLKINLINMGDCGEVFQGIAQYYMHYVIHNPNYENLLQIEINIYENNSSTNKFVFLKNHDDLKEILSEMNLSISNGVSMTSLEGIISKNVSCYFHKEFENIYEYAHISFYEMESKVTSGCAVMDNIDTGLSLKGLVSGIPSSKYGDEYRTGFGTKYSDPTSIILKVSKIINSIAQVGRTSNPYNESYSISTQVDHSSIGKMEDIYKASNWVVFVEPKVDLSFFTEKETSGELLIIHYSDQYTTSSGYDAITITHKTSQYMQVIKEQLRQHHIECDDNDASSLINVFNSINGDWLLRLVSSNNDRKNGTYFGREKISIVAGIKLMLAYLKNNDLLWVPISLEEMLRVSGSTSLSSKDGVLSAKNLGFEGGATSDDLLFVGLNFKTNKPKIYLYPVEVKTGNNSQAVITKAIKQADATFTGLCNSFMSSDLNASSIKAKVQRNFLMQLLITSCKKMKIYHIDDDSDWDLVLEKHRAELLNDNFDFSFDINEFLGNAAVLSFRNSPERRMLFCDNAINVLEFSEFDEYGLILKTVSEIFSNLEASKNEEFRLIRDIDVNTLTGDLSTIKAQITENVINVENDADIDGVIEEEENLSYEQEEKEETDNELTLEITKCVQEKNGINVIFGTNQQTGAPVAWKPNDTDMLFHTNTGIIGTMGTGKTQFTKSLITQLYLEKNKNIGSEELGILIFDYKGDYNESKEDFVKATNAKVLKPYHLPINPFAIVKPKVFKPLLPMHVANTFRDTLCKIYNLGPKQQNTIFNCVKQAYERNGIVFNNEQTWNNTPPSFRDVYQIYDSDEDIKKGDSLSSVLADLNNFELFEPNASKAKSLYELLHGVVVIDLNGYDSKIQNLIVAITLELFYSNMQAEGSSILEGKYRQLKKMILVDEADNFMSEDFPSLKKIMKEGREYGVGVVLSTQFLKHFITNDGDYSKYILTWVVHNVADLKRNEVDYIFRTESKSEESTKLFNDIGRLDKHYSIVKIGNDKPVYMLDKAFWQLYKELN